MECAFLWNFEVLANFKNQLNDFKFMNLAVYGRKCAFYYRCVHYLLSNIVVNLK